MAKIPPKTADRVDGYVSKYMEVLGIKGEPPKSRLIDSPNVDWLARAKWDLKRPHKTVLEFQEALVKNDKNDKWLERSVAHEMIHYRDVLARSKNRRGNDPSQHGPSFREGAARVNALRGRDFVTNEVVKLPTGTFLSISDLKAVEGDFRKKIARALGLGGLAILGVALMRHASRSPSQATLAPRENERGSYGTKR